MDVRPRVGWVIGLTIAMSMTCNAETIVEPISLPDSLRPALDADQAPEEEPASADEPANVPYPTVHPDAVLKSLQESVERLSAAGLEAEAAEAMQLLTKFEQKHQTRLILELQSAEFARYRSELDRLQRRLAFFDTDVGFERRRQRLMKLLSNQVQAAEVHYLARDNGLDNIAPARQRSINEIQNLPSLETTPDPVQIPDTYHQKTVLIDDLTATHRLIESSKWTKDNYPVRR